MLQNLYTRGTEKEQEQPQKGNSVGLCCINWYEGILHTPFKLKFTTKETAGAVCYPVDCHNWRLTK